MSIAERLATKVHKINALFSTDLGREVLAFLDQQFVNSDLRGTDTHDTYYNLGARDVVSYLHETIEKSHELAEKGRNS